jgi:hypothetical protein
MRLITEEFLAESSCDPELALYRRRTIAMLNKYLRMSGEIGQLPKLIGREFFRAHITYYGTYTFEDTVIFVYDMERCLDVLPKRHQQLIVTLYFKQYSMPEAAELFGSSLGIIPRWRDEAIDALSAILLERKLLRRISRFEARKHKPVAGSEALSPAEASELPPKKPVRSVDVIHAVAVLA